MPWGKRVEPVLPKDPEIERTARQLRKAVKAAKVTKTIKVEDSSRGDNSNKMATRIPMHNHANLTRRIGTRLYLTASVRVDVK